MRLACDFDTPRVFVEPKIYIDTTARTARGALSGSNLPSVSCQLLSEWQVYCFFHATDAEPAELDGASDIRLSLKETADPLSAALIFKSAPDFDEELKAYVFDFTSVDSSPLRTLIGKQVSIVVTGEVAWTIGGRRKRARFPVNIVNAYNRPDDVAPNPVEEASVTWLTEQLAARITPGGYMEFQNTAGDWFHVALNSGHAPE